MPSKMPAETAWTVHYFNGPQNRIMTSRGFTSEEGAKYHACDLMKNGMRVDYMMGPSGNRIGPVELMTWCKSHRSPATPDHATTR